MIDTIVKLSDKIIKLLEINRIRRREILSEILTPIYMDLKEIHRDYLKELTTVQMSCSDNIDNLSKHLNELMMKRLLFEPERETIKTKINQLNTRKWHPKVKAFLLSVEEYFNIYSPYQSLTEVYRDKRHAIACVEGSTGYSTVIHTIQYLLNESAGEKKYVNPFNIVKYSQPPYSQVNSIFSSTLQQLREGWEKISYAYSNIQTETIVKS